MMGMGLGSVRFASLQVQRVKTYHPYGEKLVFRLSAPLKDTSWDGTVFLEGTAYPRVFPEVMLLTQSLRQQGLEAPVAKDNAEFRTQVGEMLQRLTTRDLALPRWKRWLGFSHARVQKSLDLLLPLALKKLALPPLAFFATSDKAPQTRAVTGYNIDATYRLP